MTDTQRAAPDEIAAAQLRVTLDEVTGRTTPAEIVELASSGRYVDREQVVESMFLRSPEVSQRTLDESELERDDEVERSAQQVAEHRRRQRELEAEREIEP